MAVHPIVSIVTITYNQEQYIREALDSFLMQKTDFAYEVVVADDCSTDKTQDIIREYAKAHPKIFSPILRNKNIGAQSNMVDAMKAARGKYIAICEGDDFWTDAGKLQKQVDFLEENPDHALVFHPVRVFFENHEKEDATFPETEDADDFTLEKLLMGNFIQTNSVVYRRQAYHDLPTWILPLDWYMHLYHARFGKIGFINQVMSAYRRHAGGIWWSSHSGKSEFWKRHGMAHAALFIELSKLFSDQPDYQKVISGSLLAAVGAFIEADTVSNEKILKTAIDAHPDITEEIIREQQRALREKEQDLDSLRHETRLTERSRKDIEAELNSIKNSRSHRLVVKLNELRVLTQRRQK